jgi:hypothetical protein
MDQISKSTPVSVNYTPAATEKKEAAPATGPNDEFKPLRPEPDIHSFKDYRKNIADSSKLGFAAGFIKTGNFVEKFMPHFDGLDHPGKHILAAIPAILAGAIGGAAGAGAGCAMGLLGKNIGTHMTENTLQG